MRPSRDEWALGLAQLTAERSTCLRRHVGCVLLNARGHVLATGYNGVAAGETHCNKVADMMGMHGMTVGSVSPAAFGGSTIPGFTLGIVNVPEPTTIALGVIGGLSLLGLRRKKA